MRHETCPRFGTENCCGTRFQESMNHSAGFTFEVQTRDGRKFAVHPWVIADLVELPNMWTAKRETSSKMEMDPKSLTQKSRIRWARYHHWGVITTYKNLDCPFRKETNTF